MDKAYLLYADYGYDGESHVAIVLDEETAQKLERENKFKLWSGGTLEVEELPIFSKDRLPTYRRVLSLRRQKVVCRAACRCVAYALHMSYSNEVQEIDNSVELDVSGRIEDRVEVKGYNHEAVLEVFNRTIREAQAYEGDDYTLDSIEEEIDGG